MEKAIGVTHRSAYAPHRSKFQFRSVAAVFRERTPAVVLTGMGQDGLKGCETLRSYGARVYFQNEATSVVWGMPASSQGPGLADKIRPLDQIASEIVRATTLHFCQRIVLKKDWHRPLAFCQAIQIAIVVISRRLLRKLQNLEHPLAVFAIHLAELHGYSRAWIRSGHNPFG